MFKRFPIYLRQVFLRPFKPIRVRRMMAGLDAQARTDNRPRDLLPLHIPKPDAGRVAALKALGMPDLQEMIEDLNNLGASESEAGWKFTGSQFYGDGYGIETMADALCPHPDEVLKQFVWNLTVEYFPNDVFMQVRSYFRNPHPDTSWKETEAVFAYAATRYVAADDAVAERIAAVLAQSPAMAATRARYRAAHARHAVQKEAVDRYLADLQAHIAGNGGVPLPDWRAYLRL